MDTGKTAHLLLDFLFPERCVLCGNYITFRTRRGPYPVCADCAAGFAREEGPRCRVCSMPLVSEREICMECRGRKRVFDANFSLFLYADPKVARSVAAYKGDGIPAMAGFFCGFLADFLMARQEPALLVPVPCRRESRAGRGFDQVLLLCRILKRRYGFPYARLLRRAGGSREQKTLNRVDREANLRGVILPRMPAGFRVPERVVLLDDVFTTGATANECAAVLKTMGVKNVFVLTIAID